MDQREWTTLGVQRQLEDCLVPRMLLAVAANESTTKSRRVKRRMLQNAEAGLPHGGFQRPFGYDDDKLTLRQDEAQTIRTLAERFLAGERPQAEPPPSPACGYRDRY